MTVIWSSVISIFQQNEAVAYDGKLGNGDMAKTAVSDSTAMSEAVSKNIIGPKGSPVVRIRTVEAGADLRFPR